MILTGEAKVLEERNGRLSMRFVSTTVECVVLVQIFLAGYCEKDSEHYYLRICTVLEELRKDSSL
jgi:hypothetical protein